MKKNMVLGIAALTFLAACSAHDGDGQAEESTATLQEASMNFDLGDVEPFLLGVAELMEGGFTTQDAKHLASEIASMPVDEESVASYSVTYRGREMPLRIEVFMDDIEAPDLYLFAPAPLADAIDREMERYFE